MADHHKEISREVRRLYQVEYGDRPEVIIRMIGVGLGGIMFYLYTAWEMALAWPLAFYASHAIFHIMLRRQLAAPWRHAPAMLSGMFLVVMLSFLWFPAYLTARAEPELSYVGSILIATLIVFLVRRGDTYVWMIAAEIGALLLSLLYVLVVKLGEIDAPLAQLAMIIVTLAICGYLVQAISGGRRLRLQSEAAAEKALQEQKLAAIGQLAGGIAHDFNNVLTAISGNLELYDHIEDPSERDHVVSEARAAAGRAAEVVRQLLIYARKAPMHRTPVEIGASIGELSRLSRTLITESVRLTLDLPARPVHVRVDESQFLTAMINIVVNAVDAMPRGGTLAIRADTITLPDGVGMIDGSSLAPGKYVHLSFRDSGSGIPEAMLAQVIEPFFTTKPAGKGTGLGLSMVHGFAKESGGGLAIASGPTGTTIEIYLPRHQPQPV